MDAERGRIYGRTFYLADYEPIDIVAWCNAFAVELGGPAIRSLPVTAARWLARCGDLVNAAGLSRFPFNSFRLDNVLTEYQVDMSGTKELCGGCYVPWEKGVAATAIWFQEMERGPLQHQRRFR